MAMSKSHPIRQAAESDFLDALEHLSDTFGELEDLDSMTSMSGSGSGISETKTAETEISETKSETKTAEPPTTADTGTRGRAGTVSPEETKKMENAIAEEDSENPEGYDGRAVKSGPKP